MRKICFIIALILTIVLSQIAPMIVAATEEQITYEEFEQLLDNDLSNKIFTLCDNSQFSYHKFYEMTNDSGAFHAGIETIDFIMDVDCKPDKSKYMEVLMTMLVTYDQDNAEKVSEQYKRDYLKTGEDYAQDAVEVIKNGFSALVADLPGVAKFRDAIGTSLGFVSAVIKEKNILEDVLSDYYSLIEDYSKFDSILAKIENGSEGELKEAAQTMREYTSKQMECVIDTFSKGDKDSLKNVSEFFFSDYFTDMLRSTDEYAKDPSLESYLSAWDSAMHIKDIVDFIKGSAMLVANGVVGYENLVNRYVEITALVQIDKVLEKQIEEYRIAYEKATNDDDKIENAAILLELSEALVGNRIRGEYCNYNIFNKDAELMSWFVNRFADTRSVDKYYKDKIEIILDIAEEVQMHKERINSIAIPSAEEEETNESFPKKYLFEGIPGLAVSSDDGYYVPEKENSEIVYYSKDKNTRKELNILVKSEGEKVGRMQFYDGKLYINGGKNFYIYDTKSEMVKIAEFPSESYVISDGEWMVHEGKMYYIDKTSSGGYLLKSADLDGNPLKEIMKIEHDNDLPFTYSPVCFMIHGDSVYYVNNTPEGGQVWKAPLDGRKPELIYTGKAGYSVFLCDMNADYLVVLVYNYKLGSDVIVLPMQQGAGQAIQVVEGVDIATDDCVKLHNGSVLFTVFSDGLYRYDLQNATNQKVTDEFDRTYSILDKYIYAMLPEIKYLWYPLD